MTDQDRQDIKDRIHQLIIELDQKIIDLVDLTQPVSPDAIGRISRMDAINNKSVNEAALRQVRARRTKLKNALPRIDSEGFGSCARCGNEIPLGRLRIMPESTRCVNCASRY